MRDPEEERGFRLGWSIFRRAHQAVAKRCHKATRRAKHASGHHATHYHARRGREPASLTETGEAATPTGPSHAEEAGLLTDTEWEGISALLPKQKPGQGRPRRDDRRVLCGILWIMDTGSSWRDLPEEEFGPNSTAHGRYCKWCREGLWCRIVEALGC
jgi:putative transposase of IS4/5 family DUF4096